VNDAIGLPFPRSLSSIHERRRLFVNATSHAIYVGSIFVRIQYLKFIHPLKEDATVASSLAFTLDFLRSPPCNMQLYVAKLLFCLNVTCSSYYGYNAVLYFPSGSATSSFPFVLVFTIKEDNGIRRRLLTIAW